MELEVKKNWSRVLVQIEQLPIINAPNAFSAIKRTTARYKPSLINMAIDATVVMAMLVITEFGVSGNSVPWRSASARYIEIGIANKS